MKFVTKTKCYDNYFIFYRCVRNRPATKPVALKVHNVKISFDIWLLGKYIVKMLYN